MPFSVNSPFLFILVAVIIAVVLAQSFFFLFKAIARAKEKNMDMSVIKNTVISSAVFTIAPAIAILVGVITLSRSLGIPLPWFRLSVIGSLTYEAVAAGTALQQLGLGMDAPVPTASAFVTVVFIMTSGIMIGLILVPIVTKKIQSGMTKIEQRDKKWGDILSTSMFLGMISAFLGYVFCDVSKVFSKTEEGVWAKDFSGFIPVLVMLISAVTMAICGICAKKFKKAKWLYDYALPISLIVGMACAIPLTSWLK